MDKFRFIFQGQTGQNAGDLIRFEWVDPDCPQADVPPDAYVLEGTEGELCDLAERLLADGLETKDDFLVQVADAVMRKFGHVPEPPAGKIRVVLYAQHCNAQAGRLVPDGDFYERPYSDDFLVIEGEPQVLLEIAESYAKGNQVFDWRAARSIKEAVRCVAPELVPDEDEDEDE